MSPAVISIMFAAGASVWIYTKFQRFSGNNTQQSAIAAGISAVVIFFVFYTVFNLILG
jgi:hypothetical protein